MNRLVEFLEAIHEIPIEIQLLQFQPIQSAQEIFFKLHIAIEWNPFQILQPRQTNCLKTVQILLCNQGLISYW